MRELVLHVRKVHGLGKLPLKVPLHGEFHVLYLSGDLVSLYSLVPVKQSYARPISRCIAHCINVLWLTIREEAHNHR